MSPPPQAVPRKAAMISGITVHLDEPLRHSLLVNLSADGIESRSVLLEKNGEPSGDHSLQDPLNLQNESILTIQVRAKHRFLSSIRNRNLVQLSITLNDIWPARESRADFGTKKYQICLQNPRQKIWLNISLIPSSSESSSNIVDQGPQASNDLPNCPRMTNTLEESVRNLRAFKSMLDHLGRAKDPVDKAFKVAKAVSELNPMAKAIVACVNVVYDEFKIQDRHHKEILDLAESMVRMLTLIPAVEDVSSLNELKNIIQIFPNLMSETADFIEQWLKRDKSNLASTSNNQAKIENLKGQYSMFEKAFDRGLAIDSAVKIDYVAKSRDLEELKTRLGGIVAVKPRADPCTEGTRIDILSAIESKINDLEEKNIIWISGAPGCGKSSVSLTLKSRLHRQGRIVTYFRFDRNDSAITTSGALWRSVAYDIADQYSSTRESILLQLRRNKIDLTSTIDVFTSLIEEPLSQLTDLKACYPSVIVIDALDECGGLEGRASSDRQALLKTLQRWNQLPNHFKLIVTSRQEGDITRILSSISLPVHIPSGHFLTENPLSKASSHASNDIRIFLRGRFREMSQRFPSLPTDWPGPETIASMVSRAAGIFMWATAATTFIDSGLDPQVRLERIMNHVADPNSMTPLYALYSAILESSFGHIFGNNGEAEVLRSVLGAMLTAKRPLHDEEYTKLPTSMPVTIFTLDSIREGLRSVIVPDTILRFTHKSFDDFLLSEECPPKYAIRTDEAHLLLTRLCLTTMTEKLCFNICGLETSCLRNKDFPDIETKIKTNISTLLSYSCCFWADHLSHTPFSDQLMEMVRGMVHEKLLYWFEVMSLLKEINRASPSLSLVLRWFKPTPYGDFWDFVHDAYRFIGTFSHPIAQSAPHIYLSALPFAPECSSVARHFLPRFPQTLTLSNGKPTNWSSCIFTSEHHSGLVTCIAFSPNEKYFVSGSQDKTICICDSETGNLVSGPFKGPSLVTSSFFAPDGRRIWSHFRNDQVIGWDLETGEKCPSFQGQEDIIGCHCSNDGRSIISASAAQGVVKLWNADTGEALQDLCKIPIGDKGCLASFSPDGSYIAWAGRGDKTARIWSLLDGSEIRHSRPQLNHTKFISALSFSVDHHFVVSGSQDGTILVWDVTAGNAIGPPLDTRRGMVHAIAYSHINSLLISASGGDGTLMVWNTSTREAVLWPLEGHTSYIRSIALSRDCRRALSASFDGTVRMWDLGRSGIAPVTHTSEGHTGTVRCVTFSPCGKKLASLSIDGRIRIWDATTGKQLLDPISVLSFHRQIMFSPDSNKIAAYGSDDGVLAVWNVYTGKLAYYRRFRDEAQGDTAIKHIAFRSTDHRLVTCSSNGMVNIWKLEEGAMKDLSASSPKPEDPNKCVEIVALSPDGTCAIVRDQNRNPVHYIWSTITHQPLPLAFNEDEHISRYSGVFSTSRSFFVSRWNDDKNRITRLGIWNIQSGEFAAGTPTFDSSSQCLAISPNDCHIAISFQWRYTNSLSTVIWVWDRNRGHKSEAWEGHTEPITALAFSPDGEKLASGSQDGQLRIWDTADLRGESQLSVGFLGVGIHMKDGWVTDTDGNLLFWVPKDHRSRLVWPRNIAVVGGNGVLTELYMGSFRYGENWASCFKDDK